MALLGAVFLYLIVAANRADAAAGATGDVCGTSSSCTDATNAVCDKVYEKCLIKVGKPCIETSANICVFGASCKSSFCTCGNGYNAATDTCTPKVPGNAGSDCTSATTVCTTPNSECSNQVCKCKNEFIINIDDGKCDGTVGTACTTDGTCVASSVCDKVATKCLIKAEQSCQGENKDNCISGASCVTNQCTCGAGYTQDSNKICNPTTAGTVGTPCSSGSECKTPNSECSSLGACKCKSGFLSNIANGKCDGAVGTACTAEDTCVASTICDAAAKKCLLEADAPCTQGSVNNCVFGASCKDPTSGTFKCQCDAGFTKNTNTKICEANVGTSCNKSVTCVSSSTCDAVFGKCLLKESQDCSAGNADNCVFGASCKTSCECGDGYTAATDSKLCAPKNPGTVGTPCTSGGSECTTPNSECSILGACKCKTGSLVNIANGQCAPESKGSAAGQVSMWLLSVTLMATSMAVYV